MTTPTHSHKAWANEGGHVTRLTQKGRLRLVTQHLEHGRSLSELAAENGISLRSRHHCRVDGMGFQSLPKAMAS